MNKEIRYRELLTSFGDQYEEISDEPESEGDPLPWLDKIKQTSSFKELGEVLMGIPPRLLYQCTNLLRRKREEFSGEETDKLIFSQQLEQLLKNITDPSKE